MQLAAIKRKKLTYQDYVQFPDDQRWEIIDGVAYAMSAPSRQHQRTLSRLAYVFSRYLDGKRCEVFFAPFDVRLSEYSDDADDAENVVQPDLMVYCDEKGTDEKGGVAIPDLIVEILSPSTASTDKKRKFVLYEKFGAKEYWIVDGDKQFIEIYRLENGKFESAGRYTSGSTLGSTVLKGFGLSVTEIFERREWQLNDN